jgi:DNA invertase Pin-like site-specific DNA recombinase
MNRPLPRSLDAVRGLRAAAWTRESTTQQYAQFGPASQREQIERAIKRYDLVDTGLTFEVAHSGTTVWRSPEMARMLEAARAGWFDVLLVGYSDRWQRNLRRTLELLEDHLHPHGVVVLMCDRRILSSDPQDWDELVAEAAAAERYSRRLSERITDGYAAKFEKHADQGGLPPLGFRRSAEPPHTLEIDPATIGQAVGLFERYALGTVSIERLGEETGLAPDRVRYLLRNPLFNGWMRRHRGPSEERRPAPWRADPPVSDALWAQVEQVRRGKSRGGGPRNRERVDLLAGLLWCVCGRRIRSDGTFADGRHRKLHPDPCEAWGPHGRLGDETWETPILAQLAGLQLDAATIAQVVAALASAERPVSLDRARVERQLRDLALENVADRLSDAAYLEQKAGLRRQLADLDARTERGVSAERAVAWLQVLGDTLGRVSGLQEQADLVHAIYERIVVAGPRIVSVRLTPAANAHGLALALPEVVMARPAGFEPATI